MTLFDIQETREHRFHGLPPTGFDTWRDFGESIPRFDVVSEALYEGDDNPFHIVLDVLYRGAVSDNGLIYDRPLITSIKEQLQGSGGILGHIPPEQSAFAFPIEAVDWVGLQEVGDVVYAKAYVPPGAVRDFFKRVINRGGSLKTSIDGQGVREMVEGQNGTYRVRDFTLHRLDLAPATKAALKHYLSGNAIITREMGDPTQPDPEPTPTQEEETITVTELNKSDILETLTINEIPQGIREQIIQDAQIRADAGRVTELQTQLSEQNTQLSEMRQFASIVTEIRSYVGEDADILAVVKEMHEKVTGIEALFGEDVNIVIKVEEMHTQIGEMETTTRNRAVADAIVELTDWQLQNEQHIIGRDALRKQVHKRVIAELGDGDAITETVKQIWEDEFTVIAEALVKGFSGPTAIVGGKTTSAGDWKSQWSSKEGRDKVRETWGV